LSGTRSQRPGLLVAGDALGAALPFLGEGVGKALETGLLAAETALAALAAGDFSEAFLARYGTAVEARYTALYRGYGRAQSWLSRPRVADLLARQAGHKPAVAEALAGVLAEELPPQAVFSLAGLLGWSRPRRPQSGSA
jgi:flavin-dependent dehydrogenase